MKKYTILLFTLLLFILLLNGFQDKDDRMKLSKSIENMKEEVEDKIITLEAQLHNKNKQIEDLEHQLKSKELVLDELMYQVQVIYQSNSELASTYSQSNYSNLEKIKNLPAKHRSIDHTITK